MTRTHARERGNARGRFGIVAAMSSLPPDLATALAAVERSLKDPTVAGELASGGVNVSLALVALDGLRAYVSGMNAEAADDLGTAAEEIAARHRRASTEKPS